MIYFDEIKRRMPHFFNGMNVLEYVPHDNSKKILGMYEDSRYTVINPNKSTLEEIKDNSFNVAISINYLQYTEEYIRHVQELHRVSSKFIMFSCAAPGTQAPSGVEYYRNLTEADFWFGLDVEGLFESHKFYIDYDTSTLYFWGVKKK